LKSPDEEPYSHSFLFSFPLCCFSLFIVFPTYAGLYPRPSRSLALARRVYGLHRPRSFVAWVFLRGPPWFLKVPSRFLLLASPSSIPSRPLFRYWGLSITQSPRTIAFWAWPQGCLLLARSSLFLPSTVPVGRLAALLPPCSAGEETLPASSRQAPPARHNHRSQKKRRMSFQGPPTQENPTVVLGASRVYTLGRFFPRIIPGLGIAFQLIFFFVEQNAPLSIVPPEIDENGLS